MWKRGIMSLKRLATGGGTVSYTHLDVYKRQVWNKELKLVPYHELSAGQTRDGMEVFHNEDDSYLRSVHLSLIHI